MEKLIFNLNLNEFEELFKKMGYSKVSGNTESNISKDHYMIYEKNINNKQYKIKFYGTKPFKNKNHYFYATINICLEWKADCNWYPAKLEFINNKLRTVTYMIDNEYIENNLPDRVTYNEKGEIIVQEWLNDNNELNRFNGPALIDEQGEHYFLAGKTYSKNKYYKFINSIKDNSIIEDTLIFDNNIRPLIEKIAIFYNSNEVLEKVDSINIMNKLMNN